MMCTCRNNKIQNKLIVQPQHICHASQWKYKNNIIIKVRGMQIKKLNYCKRARTKNKIEKINLKKINLSKINK